MEELFSTIRNDIEFKNKVIQFYMNETFQTIEETMHSLMLGFEKLGSEYKEMLMYYLLFEKEFMDTLLESMILLRSVLLQVYGEKQAELRKLEDIFDFEVLKKRIRPLKKWAIPLREIEIFYSYCNPYVVAGGGDSKGQGWLVLGCNYIQSIEHRWDLEIPIEQFANALGDEMRIRIIEEVQKNGEMSAPQLAKIMNLPSSAIFYHLDVLKKAAVLCNRMSGRTAFYWVNKMVFEKIINELKKLGGI